MMTLSLLPSLFLLHSCRRDRSPRNRCVLFVVTVLFCNGLAVPARAQQQQAPEDPEDEKQVGLWLDQGISADLSSDKVAGIRIPPTLRRGSIEPFRVLLPGWRRLSSAAMVDCNTDLSLSEVSSQSHSSLRKSVATQLYSQHITRPMAA